MAIIKCKMCGGDLNIIEGSSTAECEFCGSVQTVPKVDDEKKLTLFARANRLRVACDFDKAAGIYEAIVADFPEEAEAYWGLVLCKYGIEYADDPATGKKIPTCHRSSFDSILDDGDFEQAMENADPAAQKVYREEAKQFERIRKGILEVSSTEKPYDIFICYKETNEKGDRTLDSVLAQDLYSELTDKGYRVFFSRITLQGKLGEAYEPYIFAALNSAKVMLAVGTCYEYYNAVWVKNEWSRYLKLCLKDKSKHLIPCYKDLDPEDMPKEFNHLQGADLGKMGAVQDILFNMEKYIPSKKEATVIAQETAANSSNPTVDSYLKRVFMFLEDGDWNGANEYCEKVLDIDPENAQAYLGKLMAEKEVSNTESLRNSAEPLDHSSNYKKLIRFCDDALRVELQAYQEETQLRSIATIQDGVLIKFVGKDEYFEIPSYVTSIGDGAFQGCRHLKEITISDSVISIGNSAFDGCHNLKEITIPDSVISIGDWAFAASSLQKVTLPNSVTNIGDYAFAFCENLQTVTLPNSITRIGVGMFREGSLQTIVIPDSVTSIDAGAFDGCTELQTVTIPDAVTSIDAGAFGYCKKLTILPPEKEQLVRKQRRLAGYCQYCGGFFDGFIFKKCDCCGRRKDY